MNYVDRARVLLDPRVGRIMAPVDDLSDYLWNKDNT